MKSSKAQIQAKFHKIPIIKFEDQKLTSFSGILIFQVLFKQIQLKDQLKKCFDHLKEKGSTQLLSLVLYCCPNRADFWLCPDFPNEQQPVNALDTVHEMQF